MAEVYSVQDVYGAEVNTDEEQGQVSDMYSSQSHNGPCKFHYMADLILSNIYDYKNYK
jgi:hypothetical protein